MRTPITWFVKNPVATNLMMWIFLAGGFISYNNINQEEFPDMDFGLLQVSVAYLGATPAESESAVCLRIEEALQGTEDIDELTSTAREGGCDATLTLASGADLNRVLNDVKGKVDAISTFPLETEKPIVRAFSSSGNVMTLALASETDDKNLKIVAERIRNDIIDLPEVSTVNVEYIRPFEISIEVSEFTLRQYGLTLDQISRAIDRASLDLPGGTIRTDSGEILVRTKGQVYSGSEYEDIVVQSFPDGTQLRLGQIATVRDGFEEGYLDARINGVNAAIIDVLRVGKEDIVTAAEQVREFMASADLNLPEGMSISVVSDSAVGTQTRISTVAKNAYTGLLLVMIILALFLRFKLAIWVAAGIPIAIAGALTVFPAMDMTISSLTVMGFILVLGIVVDDAIVVGERIYSYEKKGYPKEEAAIEGTLEVSMPVIFGVLTTIAAFLPLLLQTGQFGAFSNVIGGVVVFCLIASLVESQLILPGHIAHRKTEGYFLEGTRVVLMWQNFQEKIADGMEHFAEHGYRRALKKVLKYRYAAWATATGVVVITMALLLSGRVNFQFMPSIEGDTVWATVRLPAGVPASITEASVEIIENAAIELVAELEQELIPLKASGMAPAATERAVESILTIVGGTAPRGGPGGGGRNSGSSDVAEVVLYLTPFFERGEMSSADIRDRWREKVGTIADAIELTFVSDAFSAGDAISYRLEGRNEENLKQASSQLREELMLYPGVFDVSDSFRAGKQEVQIQILDQGKTLGLTLNDIATQVRQAFYGAESQRIQRGTDDVRVMVRYPEEERQSLGNLEDLLIRTPSGAEVPFLSIADYTLGSSYSSINRQNGRRVITVRGDLDRTVVTPEEIRREIIAKYKNIWERDLDVELVVGGEGEQQADSLSELLTTFPIAMMVIFALLAIPLKSYVQPLIIMSVIPFGAIGAVFGHFIMGADLVFFSILGIIALSGVVVNASLVLVISINRLREEGMGMVEAVSRAGMMRFRPIVLTSVTTFIGLVPLMVTANPATFFIIPMAISLAYGVLFATVITLFLIPSLYVMLHDFKGHTDTAEERALAYQH
ncbi:MAG: efflux RND transporter permease subunit [Gammaproteobacteria bacterium]|nr:efflux RND transporter permease subunit [Gammaproteobacteria bacterium]MBT3859020.1 efflux RND transporter permease subunit [Gammaproteobacteria bacterium]MBT3987869.1 efflux RND transporter permease subunit [Gammaproteobacteria bacterium]MBT4583307.1 efflux RND transporter permease subunit [Gammaproteobacteria bacterium]MBT4659885.1 efflux RND transporter permease subunit [Gammaproteobacteria bacterium]